MISVYLNGRLGNNLFQYSVCRILSEQLSSNFFIPKDPIESIDFYRYCCNKMGMYLEMPCDTNPHHWYINDLFDINLGANDWNISRVHGSEDISSVTDGTLLIGFFQEERHLKKYRDKIINEWFVFKENLKDSSKNFQNTYNIDEYCYIHFRGGDYKKIPQYFLPQKYYLDAIEKIKKVKEDIKFLVITDDIEEANKFFPEYDVLSNNQALDFYLLSKSKYKIIPNSSFSWWASWLSTDSIITVAPNKWFNYNSSDNNFSPRGIDTMLFTYV